VPGVLAVHTLQFLTEAGENEGAFYDPGQGGFFQLQALTILPEVATHV
jgi:hypothetical protein